MSNNRLLSLLFCHVLGNNRIQRWLAGASYGTTMVGGTLGTGPTQLNFPEMILFDGSNNLLVVDRKNNRLQIFYHV